MLNTNPTQITIEYIGIELKGIKAVDVMLLGEPEEETLLDEERNKSYVIILTPLDESLTVELSPPIPLPDTVGCHISGIAKRIAVHDLTLCWYSDYNRFLQCTSATRNLVDM